MIDQNKTLIALIIASSLAITGCGSSSNNDKDNSGDQVEDNSGNDDSGNGDSGNDDSGNDDSGNDDSGNDDAGIPGQLSNGVWLIESVTVDGTDKMTASMTQLITSQGDQQQSTICGFDAVEMSDDDDTIDDDTDCEPVITSLGTNHWRGQCEGEEDYFELRKLSDSTAFNFGDLSANFDNADDLAATGNACMNHMLNETEGLTTTMITAGAQYAGSALAAQFTFSGQNIQAGQYTLNLNPMALGSNEFSVMFMGEGLQNALGFLAFTEGTLTLEAASDSAIKGSFTLSVMDGTQVTGSLDIQR
jgi:hypothetical protein